MFLIGQGFQLSTLRGPEPTDSVPNPDYKVHSSFQPILEPSKGEGNTITLSPVLDVLGGNNASGLFYRTNLGLQNEFHFGKCYARIAYSYAQFNDDTTFLNVRALHTNDKRAHNVLGRISYSPNSIFNFQAGLDRNFVGEGNRSLLLSDFGKPYPFAQIRAKFWHVEYTTQYQFLRESSINQAAKSKFATSHYISWNILPNWNLGIFETVVFRPSDTLLQRGFDPEYLNPLIFYRPQEYAVGSSDNVLLGLSSSLRWNKTVFYSQFVLDEFLLSEILGRTGWWGNKYGLQLGAKSFGKYQGLPLFWRVEANAVRPYTYSHINSAQNYGNRGLPLAHPYGANFLEVLAELKINYKAFLFHFFVSGGVQGDNTNGFNYGGDIYEPYINRPQDYNVSLGQGLKRNFARLQLIAQYKIKGTDLKLFTELNYRYDKGNGSNIMPIVGIRNALWNDYRNY